MDQQLGKAKSSKRRMGALSFWMPLLLPSLLPFPAGSQTATGPEGRSTWALHLLGLERH